MTGSYKFHQKKIPKVTKIELDVEVKKNEEKKKKQTKTKRITTENKRRADPKQ